jgi:CBS domain-containing protein
MRRDVPTLDQNASLSETLDRMNVGNFSSMPVANGGRLVGVLTAATLRDWMAAWTRPRQFATEQY